MKNIRYHIMPLFIICTIMGCTKWKERSVDDVSTSIATNDNKVKNYDSASDSVSFNNYFYNSELESNPVIDFSDFKRYQSFDEFTMRGVGRVRKEPFVYMKRVNDTILVILSDNKFRTIKYVKKGIYWYNHQRPDPDKHFTTPCLCENRENPARTFDRILKGNTIVEYQRNYFLISDKIRIEEIIFIKNRYRCDIVYPNGTFNLAKGNDIYEEILKFTERYMKDNSNLNNTKDKQRIKTIKHFKLSQTKSYFLFTCRHEGQWVTESGIEYVTDTVCFPKASLREYILQPGFDNMIRDKSSDLGW